MNEYIKKYIDQGFNIFPCIKNTKAPLTLHGFKDASNDLEIAKKQFNKNDLLIGFPTGQKNGIVVIDIDINKKIPGTDTIDTRSVEELMQEVEENYGELPDTFNVITKSGGRHLYYSISKGVELRSGTRFLDKFLSVDLKADGAYVIASDGIDYTIYDDIDDLEIENLKSRCTSLPQWIIDIRKQQPENNNPENLPANILPESEIKEIRSALAYLSSENRDDWIKVGLALKSTGSVSAYGLWNEWSKTSDKYNPNDMEKRWAGLKPNDITIASLFHIAQQHGWVTTYEKIPASPSIIIPNEDRKKQIQETFKKKSFPIEFLRPDGLVGDVIDYILEKSIMPQPIFALSAAICAVGALAGRKVQTETGIRTNVYCLNVGGSGCGKEAPRKIIKDIFQNAECGDMASVEELASDAAIVTEMKNEPSQIFLIDEVGRFFNTIKKSGASHHEKIIEVLLKMYGSPDQVFHGKSYADEEKKVKIIQPNLCLLGTTVPTTLYKGLNSDNALDGFLSRMLIFETDNNRPRKQRNRNFLAKPPEQLINKIKALNKKSINVKPNGNLDHLLVPNPQIVKMNENAYEILYDFDDYIEKLRDELENQNKIDAIYSRNVQIATQIALIVATGINIDSPVITEKEIMYGIGLSKHLVDHMQFIVENYMAQNELEHEVKRMLSIIRTAGTISLNDIIQKSQNLSGPVRKDILTTLKNSMQISENIIGTGIHARRMITAI